MKKIAIFASGSGDVTRRVVSLFTGGDRICVELVITDRENAEVIDNLRHEGVEVEFVPREKWHDSPEEIVAELKDHGIELIALDDFRSTIPQEIRDAFEGRIISLSSPEEGPREIVAAFAKVDAPAMVEEKISEEPKSVDEEWAETLKIDYDRSRLRTTPPPIPGVEGEVPPIPQTQYGDENISPDGQQPYGRQQFQQSFNGGSPAGQNPGNFSGYGLNQEQEPMPSTYLVWSIVITVLCCCIPGIVAIVFSSQVSTKYMAGDMEGAKRASERAQIWIIISFVLGVISSTLYLPVMLIGG